MNSARPKKKQDDKASKPSAGGLHSSSTPTKPRKEDVLYGFEPEKNINLNPQNTNTNPPPGPSFRAFGGCSE